MKYYNITITFTLNEAGYKVYDKNFYKAMELLLPYRTDYMVDEDDYEEDE